MRRLSHAALAMLLAAGPAGGGVRPAPYRVVLQDGSFVWAQAPPEPGEDVLRVRLHPGGLLAILPAGAVDQLATREANSTPARPLAPAPAVAGTVSGGAPAGWHAPPAPAIAVPARPGGPWCALRREIVRAQERSAALEEERDRLAQERDEALRRMRLNAAASGWGSRGVVALAARLRGVEVGLEQVARQHAQVAGLLAELQALAAEAGAPADGGCD